MKKMTRSIRIVPVLLLVGILAFLPLAVACGGESKPLAAAFKASVLSGTIPLQVQFTDESTGDATGWSWDFNGDGAVDSTDQNPSHTYSDVGVYTVILVVTGADGSNTAVKPGLINTTGIVYEKMTLTLNTAFTSTDMNARAGVKFAELLQNYTGGNVKVVTYTDGALFSFNDELDAIKKGSVDIVWGHPKFLIRPIDPSLDIFGGASRLIVSLAHGKAIIADGRIPLLVAAGFEKIGVHFLGYTSTFLTSGYFNTVRETATWKDLGGLKEAQVVAGPMEPTDQLVGLVPVVIGPQDRNVAISQGIVEAATNPLGSAVATGWQKLMKHLIATSVFSPTIGLMNKASWDKMSPELQTLIKDKVMPDTVAWVNSEALLNDQKAMKILALNLKTIHFELPQHSLDMFNAMVKSVPLQATRLATFPQSTLDIIYALRPTNLLELDPEAKSILEYAGIPLPTYQGNIFQ